MTSSPAQVVDGDEPEDEDEEDTQITLGTPTQKEFHSSQPTPRYAFEQSEQTVFIAKKESLHAEYENNSTITSLIPTDLPTMDIAMITQRLEPIDIPQNSKFPAMKVLGQIHKTFFVAEIMGGMMYIDQHAAHERVLYEQFMKD